ncbi:aspartate/glutamate racemase family protein [Bordetella sp. FB-8]|uniref:aspartate/glutamate racemase family protein n=1 Tax=Bordetella sp. FB-8 TaxID=1159870 RepID=UPI00036468A0|nr:aspartate/glutamate racemase family protein [Bordetella sp. FB-8]
MGFLGVLMLDTRFPRPPGDIGNPATFEALGIPVRYLTVAGASPMRVVREGDPALLEPFIAAARMLAGQGARMISTSCGFLAAFQPDMAAALDVPVVTSSLLQCADLDGPGVLTFDAQSLTPGLLERAGVPARTPVQGVQPGCEFHTRLLYNHDRLDLQEARRNVVDAARELVRRHPGVRSLVLECTNMPPYRAAIEAATGRPVHDIVTLLQARWQGLPE